MKPQLPIWVALTFLMLILVLFAALVFMFQGRYTLEDQIGALQGEATKSAETVTGLESATTTEAVVMADAEATLSAMEANAEVAQGQMDKLNATSLEMAASATAAVQLSLDEAAATLDATIHQPPLLKVQGIVDGDAFDPNTDVNLVISASDPQGIETVSVSVNGEPLAEIAGEGEMLVAEVVMWNSAEDGNYTFELNATDGDGMASAPLVLMVEVVDREARLQALVVEIQGEVEEIRGLEFTEPVTLTLYTEAELRENFEEIFGDDVSEEEARDSVLEYYAFDFLDKDYDLYSELIDLYSGSVLGFYDPDTKELVVVSNDARLSLSQRLTLVHELNHALQDQVYGLELDKSKDEEKFAFRALVEGESSLVETLYISEGYMSRQEVEQLLEEFENSERPDRSTFPEVIVNAQLFPYTDGAKFVRTLYQQGGMERLNQTWETPPITSEQVLHIDLFEARQGPTLVTAPVLTDTLGAGWELVARDVLGEFFISEYLDVELDEASSNRAASGWGGDRYVIHWNEAQQQIAMLLVTEWDSEAERIQFATAYTDYATRKYASDGTTEADDAICWQGEDITCLYQFKTRALIVRAPSRELIIEIFALTQ